MRTATAIVPRSPDACWRAFTSAELLLAWVPGLRRTRVVATSADGSPLEIQFEFAESLTYSLVYTHDPVARVVSWEPRSGKRDAVRGFARFESCEGGTQITYGLELGEGRVGAEMGTPEELVDAFARWIVR